LESIFSYFCGHLFFDGYEDIRTVHLDWRVCSVRHPSLWHIFSPRPRGWEQSQNVANDSTVDTGVSDRHPQTNPKWSIFEMNPQTDPSTVPNAYPKLESSLGWFKRTSTREQVFLASRQFLGRKERKWWRGVLFCIHSLSAMKNAFHPVANYSIFWGNHRMKSWSRVTIFLRPQSHLDQEPPRAAYYRIAPHGTSIARRSTQ
jgi:hypothetical protein